MSARTGLAQWAALVGFVTLTLGVGFTASAYTMPSIPTWYAGLDKPGWTPPNWLFGPVWTALYLLMAVAAWRVWMVGGGGGALAVWAVQLALNFAWSLLFFHLRRVDLALADIFALWLAIVCTIVLFWRIDRPAAWMLVPYLVWVSYATALNASIWSRNG